jgi:hypothetical protein
MVAKSGLKTWIARGETALRRRRNREEAQNEPPIVGTAGPRRAPVRSVGRHEGLHVRQDSEGSRPLVRCRGKPGRPLASSNSSARSG